MPVEDQEAVQARLLAQQEAERQAQLREGIRGGDDAIGDSFVNTDDEVQQQITEGRTKTYTVGADEYTDIEDETGLIQRTIKHTDENEHVITTVITYSQGKMTKKTVKDEQEGTETVLSYDDNEELSEKTVLKDGNSLEQTTFKKIEDGTYGEVVQISTKKQDGSKVEILANEIDKDGNFEDEDFCERTNIAITGEKDGVRLSENNNLRRLINDRDGVVVINYDGTSITAYDKGELQEVDRKVVAEANPDAKHFGEVEVVNPLEITTPVQNSFSQVLQHMDKVINKNQSPENFEYDNTKILCRSKYRKCSRNV